MPTNIFRGDAPAQAKVYHLVPGTPEPGDTFRVSINGKSIAFVAENTSVADVVDGLVAAINANANAIPEFGEVVAAAVDSDEDGDSDYLTVTARTPGMDCVLTTETVDAGGFEIEVSTITAGDPGQNEIQRVTIPSASSGGTFTLTFSGQTTAGIAYDADAATLQAALEALSNIAAGDAEVTGDSPQWTVEFKQAYANVNVPALTGNGGSLTGAASLSISTTTEGSPNRNEIQSFTVPASSTFYMWYSTALIGTFAGGFDQSAQIKSAIETAVTISDMCLVSRSVVGSNQTYTIEFIGDFGGLDFSNTLLRYGTTSTFADSSAVTIVQEGSASATNEVQTVQVTGSPTGGTFTLSFQGQTTAGIAYNADAATLKAALEALSNIDDVTVSLSGTTYTVTFGGTLAGTDVAQITGDASSLTGAAVTVVTTQQAASEADEVQQIGFSQTPGGGTFTLTFAAETTGAIDYNATASDVQTALESLATPVPGDFSVSGDAGGPWLVTFTGNYAGTDVAAISGDGANLTGGGSQTFTETVSIVSLGPEHWNDPANWTLAQVPETGDDVVLESGSTHLRYGLRQIDTFTADAGTDTCTTTTEHHFVEGQKVRVRNSGGALPTGLSAATDYYILNATTHTFQLSETRGGSAVDITGAGSGTQTAAVEINSLTQHTRHTGQVGLQLRNVESGYYEYRPTHLKIGILSTGNKKVTLGKGEGSGSPLLRFDFDTYQVDGLVKETAGSQETATPTILIENTHSSSVWEIRDGEVGFAFQTGTTGEMGTLKQHGGTVTLGDGMTISTAIVRTSGELLSIGEVSLSGTIEISG